MTIPITLLTGFLGSGKTTVLRHLLASNEARDAAVLVNEYGEIALDHDLVKEVREDLIVLGSGCVCCSIRNDLVRALCDLYVKVTRGQLAPFSRVIIETTGLADPTPIVGTLAKNGLVRSGYHLAGIVTTVDAALGERTLARHAESVKQAAVADRILVTKVDLVAAERAAALESLLARINPLAARARVSFGEVDPRTLFSRSAPDDSTGSTEPAPGGWHDLAVPERETGLHRHGEELASFSETLRERIVFDTFALWMSMMTQMHGDELLRIKAILHVTDSELPVVAQSVQHVVFPVSSLDRWPFEAPMSKIVVIARGLEASMVEGLRSSLRAVLRP